MLRQPDVDDEQSRGNGEDPVRECLEPGGVHSVLFRVNLSASSLRLSRWRT
jgi:hypothetical protein